MYKQIFVGKLILFSWKSLRFFVKTRYLIKPGFYSVVKTRPPARVLFNKTRGRVFLVFEPIEKPMFLRTAKQKSCAEADFAPRLKTGPFWPIQPSFSAIFWWHRILWWICSYVDPNLVQIRWKMTEILVVKVLPSSRACNVRFTEADFAPRFKTGPFWPI